MSRSKAAVQPQYDFIGGDNASASPPPTTRQPLRESRRFSQSVRPDESNEVLRKELHKLKYEIDSLRQEQKLVTLRHEEELRSAQAKAEADYKRAQNSESAQSAAASKHEQLSRELADVREQSALDRDELERKIRSLQEQLSTANEQLEDKETERGDQERQFKHDMNDLQASTESAQREVENIRAERDERGRALQQAQQTLAQREDEIEQLQKDVVGLKTQAGDADAMAVFKRELADQVAHIKDLEAQNEKQSIKLLKLEDRNKSIHLVEEEKRNLENKLSVVDQLNRQLSEANLQRQILEEERSTWTSYLENESSAEDDLRFDTPETLAKAFIEVRLEKLALVNELGKIQPDLMARDETIQELETQLHQLRGELEKAQKSVATSTGTASDSKARARVERQRVLANKEVEYLRAQLKMFDAEEAEISPEKHDEQQAQKLADLQGIVDELRAECETLRAALDKADLGPPAATLSEEPKTGSKRPRTDEDDALEPEMTGSRKARKLQDDLAKTETAKALLSKELDAARSQLASLKSSSRTRVLELRDNPTSAAVAVKQAALDALRAENEALLARLDSSAATTTTRSTRASKTTGSSRNDTVPAATAERLRSDLAAKDAELASADKKHARLLESFKKRSLEVREAVASILGWKLDIMANGRVRVRSMLDPSGAGRKGGTAAAAAADEERSIVFDGERGTMKVSGGPASEFAGEIRGHIEYWVDGRGEVPCFLAAATLDFWERGQGTMAQVG